MKKLIFIGLILLMGCQEITLPKQTRYRFAVACSYDNYVFTVNDISTSNNVIYLSECQGTYNMSCTVNGEPVHAQYFVTYKGELIFRQCSCCPVSIEL